MKISLYKTPPPCIIRDMKIIPYDSTTELKSRVSYGYVEINGYSYKDFQSSRWVVKMGQDVDRSKIKSKFIIEFSSGDWR